MKRLSALVLSLVLVLALTTPALAELRRGDRGGEVRDLQELLLETGWLFAEPDGIYGRDTEAAVRRYQEYAGLPATGTADDATLTRLRADRATLFGEEPENGETEPPAHCVRADDGVFITLLECADHQALRAQAEALLGTGQAEDAQQACALWEEEIAALYDSWMQAAAPETRLNVIAARAAFLAYAERQRAALEALWPDDPQYMYWQLEEILHAQANRLCQLLWEFEGEGEEAQ